MRVPLITRHRNDPDLPAGSKSTSWSRLVFENLTGFLTDSSYLELPEMRIEIMQRANTGSKDNTRTTRGPRMIRLTRPDLESVVLTKEGQS